MPLIQPRPNPVDIDDLRPTQMCVGFAEVARKVAKWEGKSAAKKKDVLAHQMIEVVAGPVLGTGAKAGKRARDLYIIDNHHQTRALWEAGQTKVLVIELADLSRLDPDEFWAFLDMKNWVYPYDADGVRHPFDALPRHVRDMTDDVFRSLAGIAREAGGYAKQATPYAEFMWADHLRRRMKKKDVRKTLDGDLEKLLGHVRDEAAKHLPGWAGPSDAAIG